MADQAVLLAAPEAQARRSGKNWAYHARRVPPVVWVCVVVLLLMVMAAAAAPVIAPHSPTDQSLLMRLKPPMWLEEGEAEYILGTDEVGRDILSRMIYGAQISLSVGFVGVIIGSVLGTVLGMLAGYFSGAFDEIIMLIADMQLAFPFILLAIAIVAVLGPDP
ncbi:MAG: ABC transporter permease, partial [Chloroflexota bacterium]